MSAALAFKTALTDLSLWSKLKTPNKERNTGRLPWGGTFDDIFLYSKIIIIIIIIICSLLQSF
jgi:hypothetical protein